ncbi:MAG: proline dehydrogenase family protein [Ignavibacteriae bacterium]|nr:proline dehydrogenase family protein [Ignavibacteriota bacterium]
MNFLNKFVVSAVPLVPKSIVRKFAGRYIAGEEISDAVHTVRQLNKQGMLATLDVLGESITLNEEATSATEMIVEVIKTIEKETLDSNVSIKLTQLGLQLDKEFCLNNVRRIVQAAKERNNFVRIDMEDSSCTDDTIWVYREIRKQFDNSGIVLQAYLHRTETDAVSMMSDALMNFRLCKGIYVEPAEIAFKQKQEINNNFMRVVEVMLKQKAYVGIATHDGDLVHESYKLIEKMKLQKHEYEFQMLLGVRPELRAKILRDGHRIRIYVPFGRQWYQYSTRRFKENPLVAWNVFKALFTKNHVQ